MSLATEILWFTNKQRELMELQTSYGMAQSAYAREFIVDRQKKLIQSLNLRLKRSVTIYMKKKIINKMIIKELQYDEII
jgi:hypothetical protein